MGPLNMEGCATSTEFPRARREEGVGEHREGYHCEYEHQQQRQQHQGDVRRVIFGRSSSRTADRSSLVSSAASEWGELVATLGTLRLGRQQHPQQQGSTAAANRAPRKPVRSRSASDKTASNNFFVVSKRSREGIDRAAGPSRNPSDDIDDGSSTGDDDDDDCSTGLGAPPLLPPALKRARACALSPTSSTKKFMTGKQQQHDDTCTAVLRRQ
ncbi:unnamed protein product [Pylaiella littoralis]